MIGRVTTYFIYRFIGSKRQGYDVMAIPKLRFKEFHNHLKKLKIVELTSWASGGTPAKNVEKYWEGDIPLISGASMHTRKIYKSEVNITDLGLKKGSKLAPKNSILILVRGSMLFKRIPIGITLKDVAFNQDVKSIIPKEPLVADYLFQWLLSKENVIQSKVTSTGIGAGKLDTSDLQSLEIHCPEKNEQTKIASFLLAVDDKVAQLIQEHELLSEYKKGVMQQLFSQKLRFKADDGNDFEDWESDSIGNSVSFIKDGTHGTHKDDLTSDLMLLSAKNLKNGKVVIDDKDRRINFTEFSNIYKNYSLREGDILLTVVGTIGRVAIFREEYEKYAFQRSVAFMRFKTAFPEFVYQLFCADEFQKQLLIRQVVSAQPGIYLGDLSKIELSFPCLEEQTKIANFLSSIDQKIDNVAAQIDQAKIWKKGLLQQMFV